MADASLRRAAWLLCAVSVSGVCAQVGLLVLAGVPLLSRGAVDQAFPIISAAVVIGSALGAVIIARHPRHRIGWLFCVGQAGAAIGLAAQAVPPAVVAQDASRWFAAAHWAAWLSHLLGSTYALTLLGLLLLLAPDGRLPSRRWTAVAGLLVGGYLLVVAGVLLLPPAELPLDDAEGPGEGLPAVLGLAGQLAVAVGLVGAAAALLARLRRSRGEERQQLRWIGAAAGLFALAVVVLVVDSLSRPAVEGGRWYWVVLFYLGYLAVPVATGIAVLRYRLYGIDVIVGQAVRLAVLGAFVTAGYVSVVVVAGELVGGSSSVPVSLLAYVVVALAFQPLRRRVARLADRIVHGDRAAPYDSLAELGRQLAAGSHSDVDLVELVARSVAGAVGARQAWATVIVPGGTDIVRPWPPDGGARPQLTVPVGSGTETYGRIGLAFAPGRSLDTAGRRLLAGLLAPAGVAFRNVRLTAELQAQVETLTRRRSELAASRSRLLTAADGERERVARQIRTEVARHLLPMPADLARLADLVRVDPDAARQGLEELRGRTTLAIESLRTMTAGVLPPLLRRRGLPAAIEALATRQGGRPAVTIGAGLADRRLDPSVEAAAYAFCAVALPAARPGAHVVLALDGGRLHLSISGRSHVTAADVQPVIDRVEAVGGQLEVVGGQLEAGGAVDLRVVIPVDARDQAASSRPTPNADLVM